jgi:tetratricopeptide (TPR) repeat protein
MKSHQIVIPLAMAFWATTSSAQAPSWEMENAAGMQAYQKQSYTEAENLLKDAFRDAEQFGEFDARLAVAMSNLAAVQQALGKFAEAELLYNRALTIREKVDGPEQLGVATSLDDLANLLVKRAKYSNA